jgi:hypothetical protein
MEIVPWCSGQSCMVVGVLQSTAASAFFLQIYGIYLGDGIHVTMLMNKGQLLFPHNDRQRQTVESSGVP